MAQTIIYYADVFFCTFALYFLIYMLAVTRQLMAKYEPRLLGVFSLASREWAKKLAFGNLKFILKSQCKCNQVIEKFLLCASCILQSILL